MSIKRNRSVQHAVRKPIAALRARIETFIGPLKSQRRVATRYKHIVTGCLGFLPWLHSHLDQVGPPSLGRQRHRQRTQLDARQTRRFGKRGQTLAQCYAATLRAGRRSTLPGGRSTAILLLQIEFSLAGQKR